MSTTHFADIFVGLDKRVLPDNFSQDLIDELDHTTHIGYTVVQTYDVFEVEPDYLQMAINDFKTQFKLVTGLDAKVFIRLDSF